MENSTDNCILFPLNSYCRENNVLYLEISFYSPGAHSAESPNAHARSFSTSTRHERKKGRHALFLVFYNILRDLN